MPPAVIASVAKQSSDARFALDCFAVLAMTSRRNGMVN